MNEAIHKKIIPALVLLISLEFLLNASKLATKFTAYHPWIVGVLLLIIAIFAFINNK